MLCNETVQITESDCDIINDSMSSDSLQLLPNSINTQSQSGNQVSVSIIHNLTSNNLIMMILVIVM